MQTNENKKYWLQDKNLEWFNRQFREPYRSTVAFGQFLLENLSGRSYDKVLDLGCGSGAVTSYLSKLFADTKFTGIDINKELIDMYPGGDENVKLQVGDWYNLDKDLISSFDGVISAQTLSWLPAFEEPLKKMCELKPAWLAFSSLFYEGMINYTISLQNYERPTETKEYSQAYYNIYSLPLVEKLLKEYGYSNFVFHKFVIDIDIEKPTHKNLGYYTIKNSHGERMQFNTCLYQPEYFVFASKL